jgi:alpha-glucosidase
MNIHKGLLVLSLAMVCQSAGPKVAEAQARPKVAEAQARPKVAEAQARPKVAEAQAGPKAAQAQALAQVIKTQKGVIIKAGSRRVGLFVVNEAAFCLSLNDSASPGTINSVFIDRSNSAEQKFTIIEKAPEYGIKTAFGKLIINTDNQQWSFYDTKGLVTSGSYESTDSTIQITQAASGLYYGAGNKATKDLVKDRSSSSVSNGVADIPYFWNSKGYSEFGVSANDNDPPTWKRTKDSTHWSFNGKAANLYLWPAHTLYDGARSYVKLTGRPKLPPRWALGYLQSQWGWQDSAYVADVASRFRSHHLPADALIFDFEWYTTTPDYTLGKEGKADFSDFNFNPRVFPSPVKQIADLKAEHFKFIGIRKPRLGNTASLDTARKNGWLISAHTDSRDLNFANPALRKWFEARTKPMLKAGVDAWWDDEGESYYTLYYWWNTAQFDLLASARPNYRHFTLNRAFSPGNQRFGYSTWSGDIPSTWASLRDVPRDLLNFSLAGMYYGACDIGGFMGTPTTEMLVRWFEAGVFFPIMRSHSNIGTRARFPFLWGEEGESAMRKALDLRYQLLPYIYSLGHEAYRTGAPIMRPLVMEFPDDTAVANMTDEWLLGKGLLAAPILDSGGSRGIYFPNDTWYDYYTGEKIEGPRTIQVTKALDEIPVYVRAGTILPIGPVIQYSGQVIDSPLEIRIYPGTNARFTMVEDDGTSYNYTKGNVRITTYFWNEATKTLTWTVSGSYRGNINYKTIKAVVGNEQKVARINKEGKLTF